MSGERSVLGRRKLLVIGAAASVTPACSGADTPLGGPYGGTANGLPNPTRGTEAGIDNGGSNGGSGGGSTSSSSGSTSSTSSGSTSSSSGSSSTSSGGGTSGSTSGSSSGSTSSGSGSSSGSTSGSGSSSGSSSGAPACPTSGNSVTLSFSNYPSLMNVGGHATLSANGYSDPNCGSSNIIVVQASAGQYVAFSTACPHACCDVSFTGSGFHCPCHQAQFDMTGASAGIRTNQPLPSLMVCADANGVTVSW